MLACPEATKWISSVEPRSKIPGIPENELPSIEGRQTIRVMETHRPTSALFAADLQKRPEHYRKHPPIPEEGLEGVVERDRPLRQERDPFSLLFFLRAQ